jgi:hypothetical protein
MVKDGQQEHCGNPHDDQHCCKDECSPKQKSFEAVQLPAGDRHNRNLYIQFQHNGTEEREDVTAITDDCDLN